MSPRLAARAVCRPQSRSWPSWSPASGLASSSAPALQRGPHGELLRIDPSGNEVAGKVSVGSEPTGVAVDSGHVWVTSLGDSSVWQIDAGSLRASRIPTQGSPIGVAVRGGTAYVADSVTGPYGGGGGGVGQVTAISAEGGRATTSIATHTVVALANGTHGLWVTRQEGVARVALVSDIVGTIDKRVPIRSSASFPALAVGADGVWALEDAIGRRLWRIDPARGRISATIALPFAPAGIAAGPDAVWVTGQLEDEVVRIDPATNRVVAIVKVGREPLAVAVDGGGVWVANTIDRTVMRIDPATNRVAATLRVDLSPTAIAIGGGSVWVAGDAS